MNQHPHTCEEKRRRIRLIAAVLVLVTLLAQGCFWNTVAPGSKQSDLYHQIETLMAAKMAGRWDQVYTLLDPAFRAAVPLTDYLRIPGNTQVRSFTIEQVDIEPEGSSAGVMVRCDISAMGIVFRNVPEIQQWRLVKNAWYLTVRPPEGFPFQGGAKPAQ